MPSPVFFLDQRPRRAATRRDAQVDEAAETMDSHARQRGCVVERRCLAARMP